MSYEILSTEELKKILGGITSNKLTKLIKNGLPYVDLKDNCKVFLKSSVVKWLRENERPKSPEKKLAQPQR